MKLMNLGSVTNDTRNTFPTVVLQNDDGRGTKTILKLTATGKAPVTGVCSELGETIEATSGGQCTGG
jgi:hypothetical protein